MTIPVSNSVATHSIDRAAFENFYAGPAPWDIGNGPRPGSAPLRSPSSRRLPRQRQTSGCWCARATRLGPATTGSIV